MKVAAGALGAGQLESRWGEHNDTNAGSGLPAIAAGGLMVRSGEGLPMEMRAWENYDVWAPWPKEEQAEEEKVEKSRQYSLRRAPWFVPLFKAAGSFFSPSTEQGQGCSG